MMKVDIGSLIGKTFTKVVNVNDAISFENDLEIYALQHIDECCESVYIEDITGDISDLECSPIVMSEEIGCDDTPDIQFGVIPESYTWTFYKFATAKGYVTVRFYGTSNGYYSERANLYKIK